jgi:hypothetical protein
MALPPFFLLVQSTVIRQDLSVLKRHVPRPVTNTNLPCTNLLPVLQLFQPQLFARQTLPPCQHPLHQLINQV